MFDFTVSMVGGMLWQYDLRVIANMICFFATLLELPLKLYINLVITDVVWRETALFPESLLLEILFLGLCGSSVLSGDILGGPLQSWLGWHFSPWCSFGVNK